VLSVPGNCCAIEVVGFVVFLEGRNIIGEFKFEIFLCAIIMLVSICFPIENVTMLFEQLYHKHHSNNPAEDLIKAAANGDLQKLEEMLSQGTCHVSIMMLFVSILINAHHRWMMCTWVTLHYKLLVKMVRLMSLNFWLVKVLT